MCNVFVSAVHPDISWVSLEANLWCFSCVNPVNFFVVDGRFPPVWSPVSLSFTMRPQRQEHSTLKLWILLIFHRFAILLWFYPAGQRTSPLLLGPPAKATKYICKVGYVIFLSQSKNLQRETVRGCNVFFLPSFVCIEVPAVANCNFTSHKVKPRTSTLFRFLLSRTDAQ